MPTGAPAKEDLDRLVTEMLAEPDKWWDEKAPTPATATTRARRRASVKRETISEGRSAWRM